MIIGIGESRAKNKIVELITRPEVDGVSSGRCHLGGIDIWVEEITAKIGKEFYAFPPKTMSWESGFKLRNIQIAQKSNELWCISVDKLPSTYSGMRFNGCYHCARNTVNPYQYHVKSGGCWTMHYAIKLGKKGNLFVVENFDVHPY